MTLRDPVCGMNVNEEAAFKATLEGREYFFCSAGCREKFLKEAGVSSAACCGPSGKKSVFANRLFLVLLASCISLVASFYIPALASFRFTYFKYLGTIWWAVLLGLVLGGVIDYYVPREYVSKVLARKGPLAVVNAVFLGFLMSACSHGILALSIQLHKKGAANPAVVGFLLASPWANFTVTVMLLGFFGAKGLLIILAALAVAINSGLVFLLLEKKGLIEKNPNSVDVPQGFSILGDIRKRCAAYRPSAKTLGADLLGVAAGTAALSGMVLWWIALGVLFASLAGTLIPVHFFHRYMGPGLVGLAVTLALATVIEVCSEGSSPLAFEIYRQTKALGNSFVFLMAGVATDYTEIGLLWSNVGRRVALWFVLVSVPQVLILGFLFNLL